jgi:hypothetical protein
MTRIEPIDREATPDKARELLDELARQGTATDPKVAAIVAFIGLVSPQQLTGGFNLVAGIHPATTARSAA